MIEIAHPSPPAWNRSRQLVFLRLVALVAAATTICVAPQFGRDLLSLHVLIWIGVLILVELFPVPTWSGSTFTVSDPLLLAAAMVMPPGLAFLVTVLSYGDVRELRGGVGLSQALFNRGQSALAVLSASLVFHGITSATRTLPVLAMAVVLMTGAFYVVNLGSVAFAASLLGHVSMERALRELMLDAPLGSALCYLSFGCLGFLIAQLVRPGQATWLLLATVLPLLILLRGTVLHLAAVHASAGAARRREEAFRQLAESAANEREEERMEIAAALHDDVIPLLQSMNLDALVSLSCPSVAPRDLVQIRDTSLQALEELRTAVSSLRASSLGADGLATSLRRLAGGATCPPGSVDSVYEGGTLSPAGELLLFQIAREAIANARRHSGASRFLVRLETTPTHVVLSVADDGVGFDPTQVAVNHFGIELMQERAAALGGQLEVRSDRHGTEIRVQVPLGNETTPAERG